MAAAQQSKAQESDKPVERSAAKYLEFSNTESPQKINIDSPGSVSMMDFSLGSSITSSLTPPPSQASSGSGRRCQT